LKLNMKSIDFEKLSGALKQKLREALRNHDDAFAFKKSGHYLRTLKSSLEALRLQEETFADFVIQKQREIDAMEPGLIRAKMQDHLNLIAKRTYDHFSKLFDKYHWMLRSEENNENEIRYTQM